MWKALLLATVFTLPSLAVASVDLNPRYIDTFSEGVAFHRLYFADGEKKIGLSLNHETEVTADSGGALFHFKKFPEASLLVVRSRHSPDDPFEGAALDRYRESAKRLLPVQARDTSIREESPNPLPINKWHSYRLLLSYAIAGRQYLQHVTFLNLDESDQIVLITSAPEDQFAEAAERSYQLIRTWQPLLPGDERPPRHN